MPKRVSKEPIFISIATEHPKKNQLSGKYNFHSLKNNAAVFVRDGGEIEKLVGRHPYYLVYQNKYWNLQSAVYLDKGEDGGWLTLCTKGFCLICSHGFNIVLRN